MSNRDSLRKLSKKMPPASDLMKLIDDLRTDSDRTVAIVGASLVESTLQTLLVLHFKGSGKDLLPRLFENRGPLSDFNSKILIAQAFGVLPEAACEELQAIRHIRNVFAHARLPVSFETPEIDLEVQRFRMLMAMKGAEPPPGGIAFTDAIKGKNAFLLIVHIILIVLDSAIRKKGGAPVLEDRPEQSA